MSINHNYLKRLVEEMEDGATIPTPYSWLDLAQEVIRLRKELRKIGIDLHETILCNGGTDIPVLQGITAQAKETKKQIDHILGDHQ